MRIYIYDSATGEYIGEQNAQPNPKRAGEFLYPQNSTTKTPPSFYKNEGVIFKNGQWDIVKDYRGKEIINLKTKDITIVQTLGDIPKDCELLSDYLKSDEYKQTLKAQEKQAQKTGILNKISELDLKRIRAICEPSIKDDETKETWLEYYTSQIIALRKQLEEF